MKTNRLTLATLGVTLALAAFVSAQDAPKPVAAPAPAPAAAPPKAPAPAEKVAPEKPLPPLKEGELRLNFRGAPLDMVLNYLSEAAGFTIVLEAPARGTVDVWSNQPVTKQEAVELLNSVLSRNGLTTIQTGRTLTILTKDEAKKRDIEITSASDPNLIPKTDKVVTHILPVRYIDATQALRDLTQLLPPETTITANQAGNSLIITGTQATIRRVAEIIHALDTAVSGVATIKVFPLKYADSKTMATTIKELFAGGSSSRDPRSAMASFIASRFGGGPGGGPGAGGGPPGFGGPGGDRSSRSSSGSSGSGSRAQAQLVATADEFSNSVIVSAPDEMIASVTELVEKIDQPVEDLTELKVFRLKNADPTEMATLLTQLFPDPNASRNSTSSRFSGPTPPGFPGSPGGTSSRSSGGSSESDRMKKQTKVTAVADPRTSSIIVTASKDLMAQIVPMVDQLDSDPARKQKVFVYDVQNADVGQMEQMLQSLFQSSSSTTGGSRTSGSRGGSTQSSPLTTRGQQNQSSGTGSGTGLGGGNSGIGGGNSGGAPRGFQ